MEAVPSSALAPPYVSNAYPYLLGTKEDEKDSLSAVLMTSLPHSGSSFTSSTYDGQWFIFNARILPYKLSYERKELDGSVGTWSVEKMALALPRDGAM